MKICIVTTSLGEGGAERAAAMQSIMLSEIGYEVHIVLMSNIILFDYKGTIFNLGKLKDISNSFLDKIKRIIVFRKYLKQHNFDAIIDNRAKNNNIINEIGVSKFVYRNFKTFYVIHSGLIKQNIVKNKFKNKWLYNHVYKIICVSEGLNNLIKPFFGNKKTVVIHNAVDINYIKKASNEETTLDDDYILYCGRFDEASKNISLLIKAYSKSQLHSKDIKLMLLGDGIDKAFYKSMVNDLKMSNHIIFNLFVSNPFVYMKRAMLTVLTSHYEGFPMVLIESLACGTPVLAINCETGPSEIIENNINGILLETYNEDDLTNTLNNLFLNKKGLEIFKNNSVSSIKKFSKEIIAKQWKALLEN